MRAIGQHLGQRGENAGSSQQRGSEPANTWGREERTLVCSEVAVGRVTGRRGRARAAHGAQDPAPAAAGAPRRELPGAL